MGGWSNQIPNPFVVGGSGVSGRIEVYNASGVLIGLIDETGIYALFGDTDGRYALLDAATQARLALRPDFPGLPGTDFGPGGLSCAIDLLLNAAPSVTLESPTNLSVVGPAARLFLQSPGFLSAERFAILEAENIELNGDVTIPNYGLMSRNWKYKTAATTRLNQGALFSDPDIIWPSVPVGVYKLHATIVYRTSAIANDVNFSWQFSGTATMPYTFNAPALGATGGINAINQSEALLGGTTGHGAITTNLHVNCEGLLTVTAVGDLQFQFSQNPAAVGTSVTIDASTNAVLERIA